MAMGLAAAAVLSLSLDQEIPGARGVIVSDRSVRVGGGRVGLVGYYDCCTEGGAGGMLSVLHLGPAEFVLARCDLDIVLPVLLAAGAFSFWIAHTLGRRSPAFDQWLRRMVNLRSVGGAVGCLVIGTIVFGFFYFSQPTEWRRIRKGMTRDGVLRTMPDSVWDLMDTERCDRVMRQRRIFGIERWWMMRVTYDENLRVETAAIACINPLQIEPSEAPWVKVRLE